MDILISIIVPVYNVERYLNDCIKSIINQTYKNLEILLIDDGSTDSSGAICDKWSTLDNRIKVIHKKNEGQSVARNNGLKQAKGKYIAFVDSDDEISPIMYSIMAVAAEKSEADIVTCDHTTDRTKLYNGEVSAADCLVIETPLGHYLDCEGHSVWRRIYRTELFDNICFPSVRHDEDVLIMYSLMKKARKTVWIDRALYFWNQEPQSLSRGKVKSLVNQSAVVYENVKLEYPTFADYAKVRSIQSSYRMFTRIIRFGLEEHLTDDFLKQYKDNLSTFRNNIFIITKSRQFNHKDIVKIISLQLIIPLYAKKLRIIRYVKK